LIKVFRKSNKINFFMF